MPRSSKAGKEPGAGTLVKEVVQDAEQLLGQQIELLRSEVHQELREAKTAALAVGAGAGLVAAGGLLSTLMVVHGLQRATGLPLWGCYGVVGGLLGAAGLGLLEAGRRQAAEVELLPQTAEALRENVSWLREQASPAET